VTKNNKTILIIDDNEDILKPLGILLSSSGYSIKKTTNGKDALFMQKPFADLILLDMRLQGIKGQDICIKIKGNKETQHIPIIMFSADNRGGLVAKQAGADDFIEKPFTTDSLLKKIKEHIRKPLQKFNLD